MAKFTVWQCDRCGRQLVKEDSPLDWMKAELRETSGTRTAERLWCGPCWSDIKQPIPKAAENGNAKP